MRDVGHGCAQRRARAQHVELLVLVLRDGLVRRCGARGRPLERVCARLRHEPRGVRVAVLDEVVDQRAALALARVALLLLGTPQLVRAQLALAPLGLLLLLERLRVRLFALLV